MAPTPWSRAEVPTGELVTSAVTVLRHYRAGRIDVREMAPCRHSGMVTKPAAGLGLTILLLSVLASLAFSAPLAVTIKTSALTPATTTAPTVGVNSGHSLHSSYELFLRRLGVGGALGTKSWTAVVSLRVKFALTVHLGARGVV